MTSSPFYSLEKGAANEGISSYERYLETINQGIPICHDDRIKLTAFKVHPKTGQKFPLKGFWYRSKMLHAETKYYRDDSQKLKPYLVHYWNMQEIRGTVLEGTFLKIERNNIILELHNILNRYPDKSRLNILVKVLKGLYEAGILNPGSLSSFYRVAHIFNVSEYELRYDFNPNLIDLDAVEKLGNRYEHTLYFTQKKVRTGMKIYRRKDFMRFEMIFRRRDISLKGTPEKIIRQIPIKRILARKPDLNKAVSKLLENKVYLESLAFDGEELFRMSEYMFYLHRPNRPKQGL